MSFQLVNEIVEDFNLKFRNDEAAHMSKCVRFEVSVQCDLTKYTVVHL